MEADLLLFFFAVVDLPTIVVDKWQCLPNLFGMEAPPSSEGSLIASILLSKVLVPFIR